MRHHNDCFSYWPYSLWISWNLLQWCKNSKYKGIGNPKQMLSRSRNTWLWQLDLGVKTPEQFCAYAVELTFLEVRSWETEKRTWDFFTCLSPWGIWLDFSLGTFCPSRSILKIILKNLGPLSIFCLTFKTSHFKSK